MTLHPLRALAIRIGTRCPDCWHWGARHSRWSWLHRVIIRAAYPHRRAVVIRTGECDTRHSCSVLCLQGDA